MLNLIAGLLLFLGTHSVAMIAPTWRARTLARLGPQVWSGAYSLVALLGFVLIVIGFGAARESLHPITLYDPPTWARHLTLLLMIPVFPLLLAAYLPGRISAAVRHPMLAAVKIWAFAHLLDNGSLADVLLFGSFLAWAVADRISLARRPADAPPGGQTSPLPSGLRNDRIAVIGGLLLYLVFLFLAHQWLIGRSPLA